MSSGRMLFLTPALGQELVGECIQLIPWLLLLKLWECLFLIGRIKPLLAESIDWHCGQFLLSFPSHCLFL